MVWFFLKRERFKIWMDFFKLLLVDYFWVGQDESGSGVRMEKVGG